MPSRSSWSITAPRATSVLAEPRGRAQAGGLGRLGRRYDPHGGPVTATGWSAYDTLRCSTETVAAAAGEPVDVSPHRAVGSLLGVLRDEAGKDATALVVVDEPADDRWMGGNTRRWQHSLEHLDRPWVVVPRQTVRARDEQRPLSPASGLTPRLRLERRPEASDASAVLGEPLDMQFGEFGKALSAEVGEAHVHQCL
jgi:hypothetical protein